MSAPFNLDLALSLAQWSQLSYGKLPLPAGAEMIDMLPPSTAPDGLPMDPLPAGAEMIDMLPARDVQCLVGREMGRLILAFRGTDDIRGWLTDASIAFLRYGPRKLNVKMHTGFAGDACAIAGSLLPIVRQARKDGLKIYVGGHSKGAGDALSFVYYLAKENGVKVDAVYTFGGPRVFNRAGSRDYEALLISTWRILDEEDIVCRIPWRLGLYRHVGQTAFFDAYGQMAENEPWYAHIESDVIGIAREAFRRKNAIFADHPCALYIDRLMRWREQVEGG